MGLTAVALAGAPGTAALGQIVDGTSPHGRSGFYFLPPMVPDPGVAGDFDAGLMPEADVCVLTTDRSACTSTTVAELDTAGEGANVITVDAEGESYNAVWKAPKDLAASTNRPNNTRYRLEVFQQVGSVRERLGFADLWVVSKSKDLKTMPAGFVGVVRGTPLSIKFRIQTTTVGVVTVTPDPASIPLGQSQAFDAAVVDLHDAPMSGVGVDWTTDPTGIATLSPTSSTTDADGIAAATATGVDIGTTSVVATAGGATGSATVDVFAPLPAVVDDDYTVTVGGANLSANVTGNDVLGVPAGSVTSYGGGSLGGAVTDTSAGTATALAGGTLQLDGDGTLTLTGPTIAGVYTFDYRVTNSAGFDDATVTITVRRLPDASNDAIGILPGATLVGDLFADNGAGPDDRGFPQGDVVSFGGGDLGGTVDGHAAGASVTLGTDGQVSVDAAGTLSGTAPTATGTYTFDYRLTNAAGSDTASVTLTVQRPPTAADDGFTTAAGSTLNGDLLADNGHGADDAGEPAGTVTSFGGGSVGGSVTTHGAGSTVSLGGGNLTVNTDGTFAFTPTVGGAYTFDYRLANAAGASDATVTITVTQAPTAVADAPSSTSAPGDAWHTAFDTTLDTTTHATPSVLANDTLGIPEATLSSFGGGTLGGAVGDHAPGSTAIVDGHSLTVGSDGHLQYTPKTGFTGPFTFDYRIMNAGGTSDATVTIAVGVRPAAVGDAYPHTLVGNIGVDTSTTGSPFSVLGNDEGDALAVTVGAPTSGEVTLNADGTFAFDPAAGFRDGNASFTYTVTNGFGTSAPATVTIPVGTQVIWFVDNAAPTCTTLIAGCGRLSEPLSSLAAFSSLNDGVGSNPADNHHVFVHESATAHSGPVPLRSGQRLIGQDATSSLATLAGVTTPPHSPALPVMNSGNATTTTITSGGDGVVLGSGNRLHGFQLGNAAGTALTGTGFGTLVVSDVAIDTTGRALNLENGTAGSPFAFTSVSSSGGANNVRLAAGGGVLGGTFSLGSGALSGSTAEAFVVTGGTATVTYAGTISNAANRSVSISNRTGGAVTLSGAISDTGTGIQLASNTGSTVAFTGTLSLSTPTTGFVATGGGTVRATGAGSTITATIGPALSVQNTTIHADGVTFERIASTGGTNGIVLASTGSAGGLSVTGTTTAGSGGTISGTTGDAVSLSSTAHVSLHRMLIQNSLGSGINGNGVTNLSLANSTVSNSGDDVAADEAGIRFTNLHGAATFTNVTVSGSIEDNARVINTSGNLTFAMTGSTIRDTNAGSGGNNGLLLQADGTATITADVDGSSFLRNRATGVQVVTNGGGTIDVDLGTSTPNTYADNNVGVSIAHNSSGTLTFDVAGSTFSAPTKTDAASPINLNLGACATNLMSGTAANNTITNNSSLSGPGIRVVSNGPVPAAGCPGPAGTMTVALTNNTISQVANRGIETLARDGASTINATYRNNTITLTDPGSLDAIFVSSGALSADTTTICADLADNTISTTGANDIRVRNRFAGTTFRLEGYAGSATDMAAVAAYLKGRNSITTASADHDPGNAGFLTSAGCPTP